jgi:hypothetical protein
LLFDVPRQPGPVVSAVRLGDRVLVRRTDFDDREGPLTVTAGGKTISVPRASGRHQILQLSP